MERKIGIYIYTPIYTTLHVCKCRAISQCLCSCAYTDQDATQPKKEEADAALAASLQEAADKAEVKDPSAFE